MSPHIDSSEVKHLSIDLSEAPARSRRRAGQVVRRTVLAIERDAKLIVPVDTGNLKNSISSDIQEASLSGEVGPTAHYGHYVEEGTSKMSPQPYMRPAADRNTPGFERAMGQIAEDSVLGGPG